MAQLGFPPHVVGAVLNHSMRAYYVPAASGLALVASAFMPWMMMGDIALGGVPNVAGLWVLALGKHCRLNMHTKINSDMFCSKRRLQDWSAN